MLNTLMLTAAVLTMSASGVIRKYYTQKSGGRAIFVTTALSTVFAAIFFVFASGFKLHFSVEILPYALGFALGYGGSSLFGFLAIKTGPLSLTSLVTSYSLIIPTFYGLIFLGESASIFFWIGLVLLLVSLFLINMTDESGVGGDRIKITLPWVICALVAFLANGIGTTVQTMQVKAFNGSYKNELMIVALMIAAVIIFGVSFITEKRDFGIGFKRGLLPMLIVGVANGALNLLVMMLNDGRMNASILFPVISAGGIIVTWVVARFVYRESLTRWQNIALVLGIVSVMLMNI